MAFVLISNSAAGQLLADDPLVPAAQCAAFDDALALLAGMSVQVAAAVAAGHQQGLAHGLAEGRAAAKAEAATALAAAAQALDADRAALRAEAAALAVAIVRRIAAGIGPADTVGALAATAAATLAPDPVAEVRVPPPAVPATIARLGAWPQLVVVADAALAADECEFRTAAGVVRAGLDVQLAAIAAGLSGGKAGATAGGGARDVA